MGKYEFCKIIELEDKQVIFVKVVDHESEENLFNIEVSCFIKGNSLKTTLGKVSEEKADRYISKATEELAKNFLEYFESIFK